MRIDRILAEQRPVFSFEFFPPKTDEGQADAGADAGGAEARRPEFVSVTYGAGGTTRDAHGRDHEWIKQELGVEAMAHLSCVGEPTRASSREILAEIEAAGIENVLALRGDPPRGETEWKPHPGRAALLDRADRADPRATRTCASAPPASRRCTPSAPTWRRTSRFAKEKVEAGASFLISQLFFDNDLYFDVRRAGPRRRHRRPDHPGHHADHELRPDQADHGACAAPRSPTTSSRELAERADDAEAVASWAIAYATLQCADLLARGAPGIHFYTLNRSPATRAILAALRAAHPWTRAPAPV